MSEGTPYFISARKYRPSTFRSVVGQNALAATLKNAIANDKIAQAYLFCGPRGVGKTSCARIFAKTINCMNPDVNGDACGKCESCLAIDKGSSFDLVELDAASNNSVDNIRAITEQVNVPPQNGRYRVFIIDEVHMLSTSAFNAFLKTLEEPPRNVVFILATTEKHKVIPTILSRCQIYDFKRINVNDIVRHLEFVAAEEGVKTEREALAVIAEKADGAMRDALSIFDQISASTGGDITYSKVVENLNVLDHDYYFRLMEAFRKGDAASALIIYKEILDKGFDSLFFINGLASHVRDMMVACDPRTAELLEKSDEITERFKKEATMFPIVWYYKALKILNDTDFNYRTSSNKRLLVELALIRLSQLLNTKDNPFEEPESLMPLGDPAIDIKAVKSEMSTSDNKEVSSAVAGPATPQETGRSLTDGLQTKEAASTVTNEKTGSEVFKGKATARPRSFRLQETVTNTRAESSLRAKNRDSFSSEAFEKAWHSLLNENILQPMQSGIAAMCMISRQGEEEYELYIDNPAQRQMLESALPTLLDYLRKKLSNDYLNINIKLKDIPETEKKLPPKEFLKEVISNNPALGDFLKQIGGELL